MFCSNVSIEITESIALFVILYLIYLSDWAVLQSFWKHIFSLPMGVNIVGVCKFNILADVEAKSCAWWLDVEVVGMI